MGIQTIYVITKIILHIQKNYHRSGVHQNLYTYTESHLLIPVHFLLDIFCSSGIQNIIILLHWSLHIIQTLIHIHFVSLPLYLLYLYTCHIFFSFIYCTVHILFIYCTFHILSSCTLLLVLVTVYTFIA